MAMVGKGAPLQLVLIQHPDLTVYTPPTGSALIATKEHLPPKSSFSPCREGSGVRTLLVSGLLPEVNALSS